MVKDIKYRKNKDKNIYEFCFCFINSHKDLKMPLKKALNNASNYSTNNNKKHFLIVDYFLYLFLSL